MGDIFIQEQTRSSYPKSGNKYAVERYSSTGLGMCEDTNIADGFIQGVVASLVIQPKQVAASIAKEIQNTVEGVEQSYFTLKQAFAEDIHGSSGDKYRLRHIRPSPNLLQWACLCLAQQ